MSAVDHVRATLFEMTGHGQPAKLVEFARDHSIPPKSLRFFAKGRPINVASFLKIAAAAEVDPVTGEWVERRKIGELNWQFIALALHGQRLLRGHTVRQARDAIKDISIATISRVENGHDCTVEHFLAICRYVGKHPYDLIPPVVHGKQAVKHVDRAGERAA